MAKNSLQDKFQTSYPYKEEDDEGKTWQWAKDGALKPRPVDGGYAANSTRHPWQAKIDNSGRLPEAIEKASADNDIPWSTGIEAWEQKVPGNFPLNTMSETDVTNAVGAHALKCGFTYHDLDAVDDQYTGENMDHFYGEAVGQDDADNKVEGFVERNNYLDRL
jgi:hypothetical protein